MSEPVPIGRGASKKGPGLNLLQEAVAFGNDIFLRNKVSHVPVM